ncbi:adenosine deaminase-like protein isoform X2 [Rhynchophorus ferrugineus]|uniref:adenosine deaminase-like protein isoform X2 n=1 Tax=Rhynchophorus ferrugineus TaxID=354439 RepID=UPI003FCE1661
METFCSKLPKIELHAHLNGSLSRETLKKFGCADNDILEYNQAKQTTLDQVFDIFKIAHQATSTKQNLYESTVKVIEEFASDNVIYLELRTTPRKEADMTEDEYVETVIKALLDSESSDIMVKLILSIDRRHTYDQQVETLKTIIKYKKLYPDVVRGIDLSGDPTKGAFFRDIFEKARRNELFVAMHCAEIKNDAEVMEMFDFKPDRLGHATFIHPDFQGSAELWELYTKLQIPTDDKGVFDTTLSNEFRIVQQTFSLNKEELWKISKNTLSYSFATDRDKNVLNEKLDKWKLANIKILKHPYYICL